MKTLHLSDGSCKANAPNYYIYRHDMKSSSMLDEVATETWSLDPRWR